MRNPVEIEDIEEMRRQEGIDDVQLREEIRGLRAGDSVKLTLLTAATFETVLVKITSIKGSAFRGKLAAKPTSPRFANLEVGTAVAFTTSHIHSIPKKTANQ